MTRPVILDDDTISSWITQHGAWHLETGHLTRVFRAVDYPSAVELVDAQVSLAEGLDHHPIVTINYREVRFEVWTHDRGGLTHLDLEYCEGLDEIVERDFEARLG